MTTQDFINFIKLCAIKHPEILHDDETNNRFSTRGEKIFSETAGAGTLEVKEFCVIICPKEFDCPFWDNKSVSYKDYSFNFEICKYCSNDDDAAQLLANQEAERIGQDFCNEIKLYMMGNIAPFDRGTSIPTKISGDNTSGGKASLYGHRFEIPIRTPIPGVESHTSFTLNQ